MKNNNHHKILILGVITVVASFLLTAGFAAIPQTTGNSQNNTLFSPSAIAPPYNITFTEKGLPNGTTWHVHYSNHFTVSSSSQYVNLTGFSNGSYFFTFSTVTTSTNTYTPNPSSLTVIVNGKNVMERISFYNQTIPSNAGLYTANLTITNLPSSIPGSTQWYWSATITGITLSYSTSQSAYTGEMSFYNLPNGTYDYSLSTTGATVSGSNIYETMLSPSSGQFTVSGHNVAFDYSFSLVKQYRLSFTETGLPYGESFSAYIYSYSLGISLSNQTYTSSSDSVSFGVVGESYYYDIYSGSAYYSPSPAYGTVTVSGSSVTINVNFTHSSTLYAAKFTITNPPVNAKENDWYWTVYLNGGAYYSYNSTLTISGLADGTYNYYLGGYGIAFGSSYGSLMINGSSVSVNVHIVASYTAVFKFVNATKLRNGPPLVSSEITDKSTGNTITPGTSNGTLVVSGLPNGTYLYSLSVPMPYTLAKSSGEFTINGNNTVISISASENPLYIVRFIENGIPASGSSWGIALDDGFVYNDSYTSPSLSTTSSPLPYLASLPNGTYDIQGFVYFNGKYYFTPSQQVTVHGKLQNVTINFPTATSVSPSASILSGDYLLLFIAVVVIIVAAATVIVIGKRRKGGL